MDPSKAESDTPGIHYHVELIVFRYRGPDSSGGESFDKLQVENYFPRRSFDQDHYARLRQLVSPAKIVRLAGVLEALRTSSRYTVLAKRAWVQPLLSPTDAVAVPIGVDARPSVPSPGDARVQGSVSIYGGRLLFVALDIEATLPRQAGASGASSEDGGAYVGSGQQAELADAFHLSETRRIKLHKIHYFDHPYFGAILQVTRYK